jgi:hypothetical protein
MRVSVLKDHSNAAAFVSSTKVRIFRSDRRNSDRHGGTVLGLNAHLAIQFGIDLAKPPRMIAAGAGSERRRLESGLQQARARYSP